jgi:hypothetical protein
MQNLEAAHLLAELSPADLQSLMPCDADARFDNGVVHGRPILTLSLIVGGIEVSGRLDDCETIDDLREAFSHFVSLWSGGIISGDQWSEAADYALAEIEAFTLQQAMAMGDELARNAPFSQAEMN